MLEIGSLLDGKYKILSEIGHGGMSVVYMALNEKANKTWAVKEIRKDGKMDFNTVRQGLVAEIETLKKLKHPNLPSVVDVIEDKDTFIIVMDYIEGNSLDKALKEHGAQPEEYVIEWAKQLCDVLEYLHSCKPPIIYRDMKPANIMLKPDGNIALIDFGTAKTYEIDLGETTGIGTIGYAAPEQYIGSGLGRTDARTDIYCLGITLYHLLTGVDPCETLISDRSIRAVNPSLSPGLDEIIIKCTNHQPDDRYQSCTELLYALEHYNELGDAYKRKQKKKLSSFITSAVMTLVFAVVAIFGYSMAENKKGHDYTTCLSDARKATSTDEMVQNYLKAIVTDPTQKTAYEEMLDAFLATDDGNGFLSEAESEYLKKLINGIDIKEGEFTQTYRNILEQFKNANPKDYAYICNEIGYAHWYDYTKQDDRKKEGKKWFEMVEEKDTMASLLCDIYGCYDSIDRFEQQERSNKTKEEYQKLWDNLKEFYRKASELKGEEADIKIHAWRAIIECISDLLPERDYLTEQTVSEMKTMVDNITNDVNGSDTDKKQEILEKIAKVKSRLDYAEKVNKEASK